jgi:threonyl-tRNA synthetase
MQLFSDLGFNEVRIRLNLPNSDKPASYIINDSNWKKAIAMLKKIVRDLKLPTSVREGGAQYYGPELTFVVKDRYEREWDLASITLDFNLPQSFQLSYVSSSDKELTPALIHIRPLISIERLLAVLIEHYGLALPLWLAPIQVRIISIGKRFNKYAEGLSQVFAESNIRTELDLEDTSVQSKIRDAQLQKVPYMVIVGEKEAETESISVRPRSGQDIGLLRVEEFITRVLSEINNKS